VNKVTRRVVQPAGRIRRLTAAVVVDDVMERRQEKGKWIEAHRKRSPEELQRISELAQAAIGFDSTRGDVVSVQNMSFDHSNTEELPVTGLPERMSKAVTQYASVLRYAALLALFSLVYFFVLKPIQTKALAEGNTRPAALTRGDDEDLLGLSQPPESLTERVQVLRKQLAESVRSNPEGSASTIRAWLQEDKV
jgi:flagellar M-ring protein FliF